jgi:hypothetical protein
MSETIFAVQRALDRLVACRPFERRSRMVDLLTASTALRDETETLHQWLVRAWDRLDAEPDRKDFVTCEERLLAEIKRYQAMHDVLGKVLLVIGKEGS